MSDRAGVDPIITEARKWWPKCADAEEDQRKRIVVAKKFHAGDQWPEAIKNQREGNSGIQGSSPQPPRPCLVVDRLSQPMRRISNTIKNADFGFDVLPVGDGADVETAEIFKGYLRRVQNQARDEAPIEWAGDGAIEGGIGWFRLRNAFVHDTWEGVPTEAVFDQELRMERIANNLTVYCDPSANKPTRSDAKRMFVTEDMDRQDFEDRWPDADLRGLSEFESSGDMADWVTKDTIRIAEYWCVTYHDRPFYWLTDGTIQEGKAPEGADVRMSRVMRVPKVKGYKINACEVLERWDWPGSRIPLIPVIGEELNVDGKPWLRGVIEPGIGAQRMVNYTYSGAIEIYALQAKKAPMVPGAAVQAYKDIWQTRNIINHSFLPYDPWDDQGRALPAPTLDTTDAQIGASVALMQVSEESIKATTSTGDASLGNTNPNERSGKALEALQSESDLANSNYPDNVRRAYIYAAQLMVEIIPKITRPGQILHILGMDDEPQQVMVGQPFEIGPTGVPQPAPDVTPEQAKLKDNLYKFYDLNNGTYNVTVTMGKATATRRREGAQALGELLPHLPPEMQAKIIPDYIKQLSFPGAQAIAEKLEPSQDGQVPPEQAAAMLQQAQQQIQELQQAIEGDTVKAKATLDKAALDAETKKQIESAKLAQKDESEAAERETKLAVAQIGADVKLLMDSMSLFMAERARVGVEGHEAGMTAVSQQHEREMAEAGHERALEAGEASAAQTAEQAEAERAHQADMQAEAQRAAAQQAAQRPAKP